MLSESKAVHRSPIYTRFERRFYQTSERVKEKYRCVYQRKLNQPKFAVLGAFHGTNTGDNTLGASVQKLIEEIGETGDLQNLCALPKWYHADKAICAGGATGVESNLKMLCDRYEEKPENIALVGMDFSSDVENFPTKVIEFLSSVKFISCRSKQQTQRLRKTLNRDDIHFHFDNAFSYLPNLCNIPASKKQKNSKSEKVIGFNALNFFMTWVRGKGFVSGTPLADWYKKQGSDLSPHIDILSSYYIEFLNRTLDIYSDRGWKIVHVPFTPEDHLFAKTFFGNKQISFKKFSSNPSVAFSHFNDFDLFLSTRYHSLIFALASRTPCISFNYAGKCSDLIKDLSLSVEASIERLDLIESLDKLVEKAASAKGHVLENDILQSLSYETSQHIRAAIKSIQ